MKKKNRTYAMRDYYVKEKKLSGSGTDEEIERKQKQHR